MATRTAIKSVFRVSCLVKNLTGRVAGAADGRRPSEHRAEGKSIRMIPDILSSC
ncbi:MAG: hypothetical protein OXB98_14120 [Bryobacterales bacterium]|nr:hypothetical protein [Bryobacterales bacterium]